jgi:DNA-nicking Smr family endonuclease
MAGKKTRNLRPDEEALWQRVAQSAEPLRRPAARKLPTGAPKLREVSDPVESVAIPGLKPFQMAQGSRKAAGATVTYARPPGDAEVYMDKKAFGRMTRGKLTPEGRLDLHGMTLARAQPALIGFLLRAQSSGKRLVLVITGKGKDRDTGGPIPTKRGVLRHQVPDWCRMPPLSGAVLQITPAHVKHGGGGAYYIYLRRLR